MLFTLEALDAGEGDCLLVHYGDDTEHRLILVDGGPAGTYRNRLEPRLRELQDQRDPDAPLPIELGVVTHTDDDHINGLVDLFRDLVEAQDESRVPLVEFVRVWHNTFDDKGASVTASDLSGGAAASDLHPADLHEFEVQGVSIAQGAELRDAIETLGLTGNLPFDGPVMLGRRVEPDYLLDQEYGVRITVLGPGEDQLRGYQAKWRDWTKQQAAKHGSDAAGGVAFVDASKTNLASIAMLVEMDAGAGPCSMLLTGDARGDHLLRGLESVGRLGSDGTLHVDIFKLAHHGSENNAAVELFERVTAQHYLICANGKHDNPDLATLEMLAQARGDAQIDLWCTFCEHAHAHVTGVSEAERKRAAALLKVDDWLHNHCPESWTVHYRDPEQAAVSIELGDPTS